MPTPSWSAISPVSFGKRAQGFTLIEILVALAIFAVVAIIAYKGVAQMAIAKQRIEADSRKWRELTVALARFDEDFAQAANRGFRDAGGVPRTGLRGSAGAIDNNGAQLELVRFDGDHLSHLGYRLREGKLEMLIWERLDQGPRDQPTALPLLEHVREFKPRFMDRSGQWQLSWPIGGSQNEQAAGVEISLTLESGETITRLYALP